MSDSREVSWEICFSEENLRNLFFRDSLLRQIGGGGGNIITALITITIFKIVASTNMQSSYLPVIPVNTRDAPCRLKVLSVIDVSVLLNPFHSFRRCFSSHYKGGYEKCQNLLVSHVILVFGSIISFPC